MGTPVFPPRSGSHFNETLDHLIFTVSNSVSVSFVLLGSYGQSIRCSRRDAQWR
jgi:hypothetical protein